MEKKTILCAFAIAVAAVCQGMPVDFRTKSQLQYHGMKRSFILADSVGNAGAIRAKGMMAAGSTVDVFVTVNDLYDADELERCGLRDAEELTPGIIVGSIDAGSIEDLSHADGVVNVTLSGMGMLRNDLSRSLSQVDEIHAGSAGLPREYRGEGVLVSLYDSGVQPGHINFMNERKLVESHETESRVKAVYHYVTSSDKFGNTTIREKAYTTSDEVAEFTTDNVDETHGTHTLGIMTGSYTSKDFSSSAQNDFRGMAPDADIFVACGPIYYSAIAKAIKRITAYAEANNQPCVINLSIGDNVGPHDGTDGFAAYLNECGAKVPIILAAGNEGNINLSINKRFSDTDQEIKTVITPRSTIRNYLGVAYEACTEMQVWSEDETPFTLELGLINKKTGEIIYSLPYKDDGSVTYIANGDFKSVSTVEPNEDFDYYYTDSAIGVATGLVEENQRYCASVYYLLKKDVEHIDRYVVPFLIVRGTAGQRVDVYSDGDYNEFSTGKIDGWDAGTSSGSISNIACGENVISVGAYRSRQMMEKDPIKVGEVCDFSSYGELADGRVLPDILAPGGWIASSISTPFTESDYFDTENYPVVDGMMYGETPFYWTIMQGTSQASPAVAGIVALWLQANPALTPAEIKEIMHATSVSCEEVTPQSAMGKIDALAGIKLALEKSSAGSIRQDVSETVLIAPEGNNRWRVAAANETYLDLTVYNLQGEEVYCEKASCADTILNLSHLFPGIYLVKVNGTVSAACVKIVVN